MTAAVHRPRYDLQAAKALVASGEYDYDDGTSCMRVLLEQTDSMAQAVLFIDAAFALVTSDDYCGTVTIETQEIRGVYDEYAFPVPEETFEKFGLRKRNWYLKFKISEVKGQKLFVLSLHPLYKPERRRIAGLLGLG
jgi:hypothetical protein